MSKSKNDITPEMVIAWAEGIGGSSATATGKRLKKSRPTITKWRERVQEFVGNDFDPENYRKALYGFYDLALNSIEHNLKKNDVTMTVALMKGLNIFRDKREIEADINNMSDSELDGLIDEHLSGCTTAQEK